MEIASTQELLRDLEHAPRPVQLHKTALEDTIRWFVEEIHRLAQDGRSRVRTTIDGNPAQHHRELVGRRLRQTKNSPLVS